MNFILFGFLKSFEQSLQKRLLNLKFNSKWNLSVYFLYNLLPLSNLSFRRLMDFFPPNKRTEEYLKSVFLDKGLTEIVKLHKAQASQEAKRELQQVN